MISEELETERIPLGQQAKRPETTAAEIMPNDLPTQPGPEYPAAPTPTDAVELDLNFGFPVEDKNIFAELFESLRDALFPPKLPPLVLTSTPIPVPDRMAVKRNPWAVGLSAFLNGGIIAILLITVVKPMIDKKPIVTETPIELKIEGPKGGGGSPEKAPPVKGRVPPRIQTPQAVPQLVEAPPPTPEVPG